MKQAILFLNGRYSNRDLPFFHSLCRGRFKVAVDGGVKFFIKSKSTPDMIIGDFDSTRLSPDSLRQKYPGAELFEYPKDKDQTDCHLALDECLKRGIRKIDMVQPSLGELDHLLGNLMLLANVEKRAEPNSPVQVRLIGSKYEASLIDNRSVRIADRIGWRLSIIPLSKKIKMTGRGLEYPASELVITRGDSRPLRNRVTSKLARISVEGQAFMILLRS